MTGVAKSIHSLISLGGGGVGDTNSLLQHVSNPPANSHPFDVARQQAPVFVPRDT